MNKKLIILALLCGFARPASGIIPFFSCKSISTTPLAPVSSLSIIYNPNNKQAVIVVDGKGATKYQTKGQNDTTGVVYVMFTNGASIDINFPLPKITLSNTTAIGKRFYTSAEYEYRDENYFGVPLSVYVMSCAVIQPYAW